MPKQRRHFAGTEKVAIIKRHLLDDALARLALEHPEKAALVKRRSKQLARFDNLLKFARQM